MEQRSELGGLLKWVAAGGCTRCGDVDLGPWDMATGMCELCSSEWIRNWALAKRIQIVARAHTIDDACRALGIQRKSLYHWFNPQRMQAILTVANAHWRREQLRACNNIAQLDVYAASKALIAANAKLPWVIGYARVHWSTVRV